MADTREEGFFLVTMRTQSVDYVVYVDQAGRMNLDSVEQYLLHFCVDVLRCCMVNACDFERLFKVRSADELLQSRTRNMVSSKRHFQSLKVTLW